MVYQTEFAGHSLRYSFKKPNTRYFFRPIPRRVEQNEYDLRLTEEQFSRMRKLVPPTSTDSYTEYRALIAPTARKLLHWDCCILHAVSFVYREKAWLLIGPSGIGKSTQYFNWQRLFPGEITMISGDMPVIELRKDAFWIHPSPWNGKERVCSRLSAPLGGLVLLSQEGENRMERVTEKEMILPVLIHLLARPEEEWEARAIARIVDGMLRNAACWKLANKGDDDSTALLRGRIGEEADLRGRA